MSIKVAQILRDALSIFGPNGENWGQFPDCPPDKTCVILAIDRSLPNEEADEAVKILKDAGGGIISLIDWNDERGRTFADVKYLYQKAIEIADKQA